MPGGKRPSSLDYEAYVDELAVSGFRRALLDRRFDKALASAERLVQSTERMWRWVGLQNLAVLDLARGFARKALSSLHEARRLYPDVAALVRPPRETAVHVLVETGALEEALRIAEPGSHGYGVALAGTGRHGDARAVADLLQEKTRALAEHLRWEVDGGSAERLTAIVESIDPTGPRIPITFRLARKLEADERHDSALRLYESITAAEHALLDWPVPFVRSYYRIGIAALALGNRQKARKALASYLRFRENGEMDREEVARARELSV